MKPSTLQLVLYKVTLLHFQNLQKEAATVWLKTNCNKTKILLVSYQFNNQLPVSLENLETVEDVKYLGAKIATSYNDFRGRRGIFWSGSWKKCGDLPRYHLSWNYAFFIHWYCQFTCMGQSPGKQLINWRTS